MKKFFSRFKIIDPAGFTLIEVMIAMVILSIGLLGLAGITIVVLRTNTLSQQVSEATTIATDLMDRLRQQSTTDYKDCEDNGATNILRPSSPGACEILWSSGIKDASPYNEFYPSANVSTCVVTGVLGGTTTFDTVSRNLVQVAAPSGGDTVCTWTSAQNLLPGQYVRYFRTVKNVDTNWDLIVAVLWKDKFGKWRNVHFSTTKTDAAE